MKKKLFLVGILLIFGLASVTNEIKIENNMAKHLVHLAKENPEILDKFPELGNENYKLEKMDTVNFVFKNLGSDVLKSFPYIIILIILFFSSASLFKLMKSKIIRDMSLRTSYDKVIKREIIKAYSYSFVPILFLVILFILSLFYNVNFDFKDSCIKNINCYMSDTSFKFFFFLIFNLITITLYYINISLIMLNYNKNIVLNVISSFLIIIGIELVLQCLVGPILAAITNIQSFGNVFSSANLWYYDSSSYLIATIYCILSFLISYIILRNTYKKKERIFIQNDK